MRTLKSLFCSQRNTLSLLYALLELQQGLLRCVQRSLAARSFLALTLVLDRNSATTPFYSSYQLKPSSSNPSAFKTKIESDQSPEAAAIRAHWKKGPTWHTVDVVPAADDSGIPRADLVRCISRWELNAFCEVKVAGVRNRYHVTAPLPELDEDIDELADKLYQQLHDREEADVKRLRNVVDFVRGGKCASSLSLTGSLFLPRRSRPDPFGCRLRAGARRVLWRPGLGAQRRVRQVLGASSLSLLSSLSSHSPSPTSSRMPALSSSPPPADLDLLTRPQFCTTKAKIPFEPRFDAPFSDKQIAFVMGVCGVRDDPRFLARLAFGVSSPRITALGLSKVRLRTVPSSPTSLAALADAGLSSSMS